MKLRTRPRPLRLLRPLLNILPPLEAWAEPGQSSDIDASGKAKGKGAKKGKADTDATKEKEDLALTDGKYYSAYLVSMFFLALRLLFFKV